MELISLLLRIYPEVKVFIFEDISKPIYDGEVKDMWDELKLEYGSRTVKKIYPCDNKIYIMVEIF